MIVETGGGMVTISDAKEVLGLTLAVTLTPNQTRLIAARLDNAGVHADAAKTLLQAADNAERTLYAV